MNVLGREIPDDDIRKIAGARCWIVDGYIVKAKKVRVTGDRTDAWIAQKEAEVG